MNRESSPPQRIRIGQFVSYFDDKSVGRIIDVSKNGTFKICPARVPGSQIFLCKRDICALHPMVGRIRFWWQAVSSALEVLHYKLRHVLMAISLVRLCKTAFWLTCYVLSFLTAEHFQKVSTIF